MGVFDIKERALEFALKLLALVRKIPRDIVGFEIGKQLIRSGMSIGANLEEADGASTRNDFFHKIAISRKEANESKYWLNLIIKGGVVNDDSARTFASELFRESLEISKILSAIYKKRAK